MGSKKDQRSDFVTAYLRKTRNTSLPSFHLFPQYVNLADVHQAANFEQGGLLYEIDPIENNYYGGKLDYAAAYAMVDQKLGKYVRLVAGLRAEKQNLRLINNTTSAGLSMPAGLGPNTEIVKTPFYQEKAIDFLPSANLTVLLSEKINFRLAYSKAMIRPEFAEASRAVNYNNELQGFVQGGLVTSTTTTSYDAKLELFPGFGETISVGAFYKDLQKPLELIRQVDDNNTVFTNLNAQSAKSFGLEFEFRKRLGFINPNAEWLNNFVLSGNASILRSEVVGRRQPKDNEGQFLTEVTATIPNPQPGIKYFTYNYVVEAQNRPLYGQTPLLYNAGIEYNGKIFGASLVHNYSGRKFFFLTNTLLNNEYEAPYQQTDLQLSANLLKEKAKLKINMGNLFNSASYFYNGLYSYKPTEAGITESLLPGFSDDYEVGDQITFRKLTGRTFSISFSYKF
jgi:outer membrane receptor protein involved in Fe transport